MHETAFKNIFSLIFFKSALSAHFFRCFFHFFCFITGLIYSFAQPLFLNFEVWTFVYSLSSIALTFDAVIFIFYKRFKLWEWAYALDALFVALLIFQTGYVFFAFLFLIWLFQIIFAGLQFHFKGALLQGAWISFLLTWLTLLSPHFNDFQSQSFFINNVILFVTAIVGGFIGYFFKDFNILSYFNFFKNLQYAENWPFYQDSKEDFVHMTEELNASLKNIKKIVYLGKKSKKSSSDLKSEIHYLDKKMKNLNQYICQNFSKKDSLR